MKQLFIKLTGTVNASNFDGWKKELIEQIQSVNVELVTDKDFVTASEQVKSFKSAEKSLKQAKQSAIDQAEEIQQLFTAIDEITEEARQARLSLERQIKARKLEIKQQYIQSGIDEIQSFIDEQVVEFNKCDLSPFFFFFLFESAVSGKAGISGLETGIDGICTLIKIEISEKAVTIYNNKVKLDALAEAYKLLFQDWELLICLPEDELASEIDKRTTRYNDEMARREAEESAGELQNSETVTEAETTAAKENETLQDKSQQKEKYRILIDLLSTLD